MTRTTARDSVRRDGPAYAQVPEWVILHPDLDGNSVRLYALLDRYAREREDCYPGRKALATQLGVSVDTLDRVIKKLVAASAITVTERYDDAGDQTSNLYTVHFVGPEGVAARVQRGGRTTAATQGQECGGGGRTAAATGSRTGAAQEETHLERETPQPPASGGPAAQHTTNCRRHPDAPGDNCRTCGTTGRQLEAERSRREAERRRDADAAAIAHERQERRAAQAAGLAPATSALLADTRRRLATTRIPTTSRSTR